LNIDAIHAEAGEPPSALIGMDSHSGEAVRITLPQMGHTLLLGRPSATKGVLQHLLLHFTGTCSPGDLQVTFLSRCTETASLLRELPHTFDLSQLPQLFEGRQRGQRRRPFILIVAEGLDTVSRPHAIEPFLQEGRKWAVGIVATASSSPLSETILANIPTQVFLPESGESGLEAWQQRLLDLPAEQDTAPGRAFLFLDGKSRWIAPAQHQAPSMQAILRP
jgi:hypothetical protein